MNAHKFFQHEMTCADFDRYMDAMREEVARHKWFLSEKAGRDVGEIFALDHWLKNHGDTWKVKWTNENTQNYK